MTTKLRVQDLLSRINAKSVFTQIDAQSDNPDGRAVRWTFTWKGYATNGNQHCRGSREACIFLTGFAAGLDLHSS